MKSFKSLIYVLAMMPALAFAETDKHDYPTLDRVGFVLTCMEANGGISRETLNTCVCRIDHIAENMSFEDYQEAEVWKRYESYPGERGAMFRDVERSEEMKGKLNKARFEAKQACPLAKDSPDSRPPDIEDYRKR